MKEDTDACSQGKSDTKAKQRARPYYTYEASPHWKNMGLRNRKITTDGAASSPDASAQRAGSGERLFRRLKRQVSTPAINQQQDQPAGLPPQLISIPSTGSSDDKQGQLLRKMSSFDRDAPTLNSEQTRSGSSMFATKTRNPRSSLLCDGEKERRLRTMRSDDSLVDEGEGRVPEMPGNSSQRLSKIWEEDPGSKSGLFLSLLAIENYD